MVKKQIFAYLLLVVLSSQFLPLEEIVKLYSDNQLIEEVCQTADTDRKNAEGKEELKKNEIYCFLTSSVFAFNLNTCSPMSLSAKFYVSRLADDAPTRPPLSPLA